MPGPSCQDSTVMNCFSYSSVGECKISRYDSSCRQKDDQQQVHDSFIQLNKSAAYRYQRDVSMDTGVTNNNDNKVMPQ